LIGRLYASNSIASVINCLVCCVSLSLSLSVSLSHIPRFFSEGKILEHFCLVSLSLSLFYIPRFCSKKRFKRKICTRATAMSTPVSMNWNQNTRVFVDLRVNI